jgi:hypothetical protein
LEALNHRTVVISFDDIGVVVVSSETARELANELKVEFDALRQ